MQHPLTFPARRGGARSAGDARAATPDRDDGGDLPGAASTGGLARPGRARRRSLGQYFTPPQVAAFAWRALGILGKRLPAGARLADPALGEGAFLGAAEDTGIAPSDAVLVGVDLDPAVASRWRPGWRTAVADGLVDHPEIGLVPGSFDAVAGNPPFGGGALRRLLDLPAPGDEGAAQRGARDLARALLDRYEGWRRDHGRRRDPGPGSDLDDPRVRDVLRRLSRFPVESLFIERAVSLLRPGGWLAFVVPEGLLSNRESGPVRALVARSLALRAIVGLPVGAFRREGAAASTALILGRRRAPGDGPPPEVWLAAPPAGVDLDAWLEHVEAVLAGRRSRAC